MEIVFLITVYGVFYITGHILINILSLGGLNPEPINWEKRRNWSFLTIVHVIDGKKYLMAEWVIMVGVIFWILVAFGVYHFS